MKHEKVSSLGYFITRDVVMYVGVLVLLGY